LGFSCFSMSVVKFFFLLIVGFDLLVSSQISAFRKLSFFFVHLDFGV